MKRWQDKVVVVTGGSSGLGRQIAEAFGAQGARLAIVALEEELLKTACDEMRNRGLDVLPIHANITQAADVDRVFETVESHYGRLDVLVNNAGRTHRGWLSETSPEVFQELFELNVLGTIRCTQRALPELLKSRGHIVNIGSLAAKSAARWVGAYPVTKFAVAAFSQQLRLEMSGQGLHVLLVCPGPVQRDNPRLYRLPNSEGIPESALQPGGGVQVGKIDPVRLAQKIVRYCELRKPELVLPWKARLLFAISQLFPSFGDWIVLKKTGG